MRNQKYVLPMLLLGIFAFSMSEGVIESKAAEKNDTINNGVYISDVDVSGMTKEEAKKAVEEKMGSLGRKTITLKADDATMAASVSQLGLKWTNEEVVEKALGLGKSGNLIKRYKDNKDLEHKTKTYELEYASDSAKIRSYVENNCTQLNREAKDGSLTRDSGYFEIVPGVVGLTIDVNESAKVIETYLDEEWNGESGSVTLVADEVEPRGTAEELGKVQDVLGSATTYYGSTAARNQNVEVGAQKLDGHLLYPGESFSVTQAVIPFNAENGYDLAPSYESGKVVDSYGGGICQVSTTLYNALLKAELEILERHNHTMTVSYVDPSKDAAIAEGLMDLQFANNTDAPIYVQGYGYGGELTFIIYGEEKRSADRSVSYVSETISTIEPEGVKLYAKSDANVGYLSQTQSARAGLTAVLWKDVTENGESMPRTKVNSSTYQATQLSYEVGTMTSDPAVSAAIHSAIAANDLAAVQSIIAGGGGASTPEPETPETEPETEPPVPETPAPETGETESSDKKDKDKEEQLIDPPEPDDIGQME